MTQEELDALLAGGSDSLSEETAREDVLQDETDLNNSWQPPTEKKALQFDDITQDSEIRTTTIADKLEAVDLALIEAESDESEISTSLDANISLFETLVDKFPNIEQFENALKNNKEIKEKFDALVANTHIATGEVLMAKDIVKNKDTYNQKAKIAIKMMSALSGYIDLLFKEPLDDKNVITNEEIETIIENLRNKIK